MRGGEFCKFAEIPPGSLVWEIVPIHTSSAKNARLTAREKTYNFLGTKKIAIFLKEKTYKMTFKGKDCNNQCMREGDFQGKRLTTFLGP